MLADEAKSDAASDGLAQALLATMKLANRLSVSETFAKHGVTVPEWLLLSVFPADGTPVTVRRLSALTGLTPTRVKVLVVNLESNGLIKGSTTESGRSTQPFAVSETGLSLDGRIRKILSEIQESMSTPTQTQALVRAGRVLNRFSKKFVQSAPQP